MNVDKEFIKTELYLSIDNYIKLVVVIPIFIFELDQPNYMHKYMYISKCCINIATCFFSFHGDQSDSKQSSMKKMWNMFSGKLSGTSESMLQYNDVPN